jgi:hypothetical protein
VTTPAPVAPAKPPPEIADMLKSVQGTWTCDGTTTGADNKPQKIKIALAGKADLEGFWIHDSMSIGPIKTPTFRAESFVTYDPTTKRWRCVAVMSDGTQIVGNTETMKDMKMDFTFDAVDATATSTFRGHLDASDLRKGLHATGDVSKDKGKTWSPVYDVTCKR